MNKIIDTILQSEMTFAEAKILMALSNVSALSYTSLKTATKCGHDSIARSIKSLLNTQPPLIIKNGNSLRDSYSLNPAVFESVSHNTASSRKQTTGAVESGAGQSGAAKSSDIFTKRTSVEWYWSNNADVQQKFILKDATAATILLEYFKTVKGINKFSKTWSKNNEKSHKTLANAIVKTLWEAVVEAQPNAGIDDLAKVIKHAIDYSETNCRKSFPNWTLGTVQKSLVHALGLYFRGDVVSLEKEEMVDGETYVKNAETEKAAAAIKQAEEDLKKEATIGAVIQIEDLSAKTQFKFSIKTLKDSGEISAKDVEWYDGFREHISQEQFFNLSLNELWTEYTAKHGFPKYKIIQSATPTVAPRENKETSEKEKADGGDVPLKEEKKTKKKVEEEPGGKKLW
ncbi:MAG: hypothetical protein WC976_07225 [Caldisericia bacterium]